MRVLDLFSGIGGHAVALKDYSTPIAFCDNNPFTHRVLRARMQEGSLETAPIFDDVETLKASQLPVLPDVVTASFPCQDISTAGNGAGIDKGTRSGLVWEVFRLIDEISARRASPLRAVFMENSPNLRAHGLDRIIEALEERRFTVAWGNLQAADVGARHHRNRIWILAVRGKDWKRRLPVIPVRAHEHDFPGLEKSIPRLIPAITDRVQKSDTIKRWCTLGNAVVPQVSRAAFTVLLDLLRQGKRGEQGSLCGAYPFCRKISELYPDPLAIRFEPSEAARPYNLWLTPVYSKSHYIPTNPHVMRNRGTFATRVFLESKTRSDFGLLPDETMREARNRFTLNINWVEGLMGFPHNWTVPLPRE